MQKRILFLANHFVTLYSFRRELIKQLLDDGNHVYLSLPAAKENEYFSNMGCEIIDTLIDRRGVDPVKDFKLILSYRKIINKIRPDIIFSYTIKPNIYGCMASNVLHYRQICNVTGTGATFLKESPLSKLVRILYRMSVRNAYKVFFQNNGDKDYFVRHRLVRDNWTVIPGSGVNLKQFDFTPMPEIDEIKFIFIGRVMKLKGIDEYLACAKAIREAYRNTRFYIAGWNEEPDYQAKIAEYEDLDYVEYIGYQKDISAWIRKCHCTILPSHGGEGIPNVLLESAAMGRVCIASKINGSTEVIDNEKTGFLFEAGNLEMLIEQVKKFIGLPYEEKCVMGKEGRKRVEKLFDRQLVIEQYLDEVKKL